MQEKTRKIALAAIGVIASAHVGATPITVSETITLNTLMNSNSTTVGFDLNTFLASQGVVAGNVVGGHVMVHGFSEASYAPAAASAYSDYQQASSSARTVYASYYSPGYYSCGWWGGCYYSPGYAGYFSYSVTDATDVRYRDIAHVDNVADTLTVSIGGNSDSSVANSHSSSVGAYGAWNLEGQSCPIDSYGNCGQTTFYNRERDTYEAVFGALESNVMFDAAALSDLRTDGILDVGMAALGQFKLDSISFALDVESDAVPEPASVLLLSAGLGALAMTRRKRKK